MPVPGTAQSYGALNTLYADPALPSAGVTVRWWDAQSGLQSYSLVPWSAVEVGGTIADALLNAQMVGSDGVQRCPVRLTPTDPTFRQAVLSCTPSFYWDLAANAAVDLSGNGRNGSGQGGISIGGAAGSPILGESLSTLYDDIDDAIGSSYNPFTNGTTRSLLGWAKRTSSAADDTIFGTDAGSDYPFFSLIAGTNNVRFNPRIGVASDTTWTGAWPGNGQWAFWGLRFDEAGDSVSLNINGVPVSTQTQSGAYSGAPGNLRFGVISFFGQWFGGSMAHVAGFEYGLTDSQFARIFAAAT